MPASATSCPSCSNDLIAPLGTVRAVSIFKCTVCDLSFVGNIQDAYDHSDWYGGVEFTREFADRYVQSHRNSHTRQLCILSTLVNGNHLLDVGAGIGHFAKVALDSGWNVTCADVNTTANRFGTELYGLTYKNLDLVDRESMDAVRLSHVLEHVSRPHEFLTEVKAALKRGGIAMIIVPHSEPLNCVIKNRILECMPGHHDYRGHIYSPQHVLGFSQRSLEHLLTLHGFEPVTISSVSRGNRTYNPWKIDCEPRPSLKDIVFESVNNLGNMFGRGSWIVGFFRK